MSSFWRSNLRKAALRKMNGLRRMSSIVEHQQVKGRGDGNVIVETAVEQIELRPAFGIEIYRLSINNG